MAKVLVTLDDQLLARIDRKAKKLGLTRSEYVSRVLGRDVGTERGPGANPRVRLALKRLQELGAAAGVPDEDPTLTIRKMRDSR